MKKTISTALSFIYVFLMLSCSGYSIKNDIRDSSILSKIKNAGIIFRISNGSKITKEELMNNTQYWLSIYQKKGGIALITDASDSLSYFNPQQRFYQLSNENEYLKYKSIGVVNLYLQNNQNELLNIISKNKLDSLIVFEVFSVISTQLQFFEIESVLAVVDSNLNIGYLDHQSDYFESESSFPNDLKNQMMDKLNDRLMANLQGMDLLGNITEGEKKPALKDKEKSKPEEKPAEKPEEKQLEKAEKPLNTTQDKPVEEPKEIKKETQAPDNKKEPPPSAFPSEEIKTKEAPSPEKAPAQNMPEEKPK